MNYRIAHGASRVNEELGFCVPSECPEGQAFDEESGLCVLEEPEVGNEEQQQSEPEQSEQSTEQPEQQSSEEEDGSDDNTNGDSDDDNN